MYFLIAMGFFAALLIVIFNELVRKSNQVKEAFSLIDVYLKQRFDLIPNLVEVVKQHMGHEKGVLESLTALRTRAESPAINTETKVGLYNELQNTARQLFVSVENYPLLQSSALFQELQQTWTGTEENIAAARRTYNAAVTRNNTYQQQFPINLINAILGFQSTTLLETPETERANVNAKNLFI
jgi:LemA protein